MEDRYELIYENKPESNKRSISEELIRQPARLATEFIAGTAKVPTTIADIALALNHYLTPESERVSSEIYESMKLTPEVEKAKERLPEYLKPQGKIEELTGRIAEAIPQFAFPFGGGTAKAVSGIGQVAKAATYGLGRAIPVAIGSEAGRELAKQFDLGELGQFAGSIAGAGLGAGIMTPRRLKNIAEKQYQSFEKSIPRGAKQDIAHTNKAIKAIEDMDLLPESKEFIEKNVLRRIEPWLKTKTVDIKQAWKDKRYIQKVIRESKGLSKDERKALFELSSGIKKDMLAAGRKYKDLAVNDLADADSIYYGLQNLSPIRRFLRQHITPSIGAKAVGLELLGAAAPAGAFKEILGGIPAKVFAAGTLGKGAVEAIEPILKSPVAAQHILGTTAPQIAIGVLGTRPESGEHRYELVYD